MAEYRLRQSRPLKYCFVLLGRDGECLLASEMFDGKGDAFEAISLLRDKGQHAANFIPVNSSDGRFWFAVSGPNTRVLGRSPTYHTAEARDVAIAAVKSLCRAATLRDETAVDASTPPPYKPAGDRRSSGIHSPRSSDYQRE